MNELSVEQQESCETCHRYHVDGVHLVDLGADERGEEENYADTELPHVLAGCGEILLVAQQQGGCCQQTYDCRAQAVEDRLYCGCVHVFDEHLGNDNHQDE